MSMEYSKFSTLRGGGIMSPLQSANVPIVSGKRIFETINKTWHADCRKAAVSKILDWLVK